jgi:preprotein translocase subunit YajC
VSSGFLALIVLLFALMWVFMIRPQKRRQQQQKSMLENVAPGDEILTAGGVFGTVRSVQADEVRVEIAPGTEVRVAKRAIAAVIPPEEEEEAEAEELEAPDDGVVSAAGQDSDAQSRR